MKYQKLCVWHLVRRSDYFNRYQEDGGGSIQNDVQLLSIGYILIIAYVAIMLGKFTRLHIKVWMHEVKNGMVILEIN